MSEPKLRPPKRQRSRQAARRIRVLRLSSFALPGKQKGRPFCEWKAMRSWRGRTRGPKFGIRDGVGNASDLRHLLHIMHAHDVRATENGGGNRGGGAPGALGGGNN